MTPDYYKYYPSRKLSGSVEVGPGHFGAAIDTLPNALQPKFHQAAQWADKNGFAFYIGRAEYRQGFEWQHGDYTDIFVIYSDGEVVTHHWSNSVGVYTWTARVPVQAKESFLNTLGYNQDEAELINEGTAYKTRVFQVYGQKQALQ